MNIHPVAIGAATLALFLLLRPRNAVGASSSDWREVPMPIPAPPDDASEAARSRGGTSSRSGASNETAGPTRAAVRRFQLALQAYQDDRRERTPSVSPEADGLIGTITRGAWMQFLQDVRAAELLASTPAAEWPSARNGRLLFPPPNFTQANARALLGSEASRRAFLLRRNPTLTLPSDAALTGAAEYIGAFRSRLNAASDTAWPRYVSQLGAAL